MKKALLEQLERQTQLMSFMEQSPIGAGITQAIASGIIQSTLSSLFDDEDLDDENFDNKDSDLDTKSTTVSGNVKHKYTGEAGRNADLFIKAMEEMGITDPNTQIGILSVVAKESGFKMNPEISYANTSNSRIRNIFGNRVSKLSDRELSTLKKNDAAFFERVYGKDSGMSLGNTQPGDGYRYIGRGFNGLTGRNNYAKYGNLIGYDLVNNPELLRNPKIAAKVAISFFTKGNKSTPKFSNPQQSSSYFADLNAGGSSSRARQTASAALDKFTTV